MTILSRPVIVASALLCLHALPVFGASTEDFSGYKAGDTFVPGEVFPTKGAGWLDGWRSANSYVQVTGNFVAKNPVDSGQYLAVTVVSTDGTHDTNPSGSVTLPYRRPAKPFKLSFKFRPDDSDKDIRYFLLDNDVRSPATSPAASWMIVSKDGEWQLLDGATSGMPAEMMQTTLPVVANTTYTFAIEVNPEMRTWNVSITDGKHTVTQKNLHFRSPDLTPERCLVFGVNETVAPAQGLTMHFSLDSISLQP